MLIVNSKRILLILTLILQLIDLQYYKLRLILPEITISLVGFNFVKPNRINIYEKVKVMDWDHKGNFIVEFFNGSTEKMLKNDLITYCDKVSYTAAVFS